MQPACDYFTATTPEPWQILGLRLKPFSLGHYKLLKRFGCGFVSDDEAAATREDLILGVLICSMHPNEFIELVSNPKRTLLKSICGLFTPIEDDLESYCKKWGKKIGLFDLNEKALMFKNYIDEGSVAPKFWDESNSKESGAHWSHTMEVCLRSNLGWTSEEINLMPLSKCFFDYLKYAESQGAVKFMSKQDLELIRLSNLEATSGN